MGLDKQAQSSNACTFKQDNTHHIHRMSSREKVLVTMKRYDKHAFKNITRK